MSRHKIKRYYEFVTPEEFHDKPTKDITSTAVWEGFQSQTTAHGIPHVKNARGPIKTSFWVFASIVCCGMLIYYAYFLFDKFLNYPVNVRVEVVNRREMVFPAVTICNHNMVRKSQVLQSNNRALMTLFGYYQPRPQPELSADGVPGRIPNNIRPPFLDPSNPLPANNAVTASNLHPQVEETTTDSSPDLDMATTASEPVGFRAGNGSRNGRPLRESFEKLLRLQELLALTPPEERQRLGYQQQNFILDCEYSGAFCYGSDFSNKIFSPVYGNCFTFNVDGLNDSSVQKSYRPGPTYGLALTLNIDQDEYHADLTQEAGVRIVVHDRNRMPFPEDEGVSVTPGQMTFVGLRMLTVSRLGSPYGKCTDITRKDYEQNAYSENYGVHYSANACYKTCLQRHVIERCRCASAVIPRRGRAFRRVQHICSIRNEEQQACYERVQNEFQNDKLDCDCPTACTESTYALTTSAAAWPSDAYKNTLFADLTAENEHVREVLGDPQNPNKYKDNLVRVVIYFEEFNFEDITEFPAYESFQFVSDIGGILGLFVGFSVMTISEFLELGLDLLVLNVLNKCNCCRKHNKRRVQTSTGAIGREMALEDIDRPRVMHSPPDVMLSPPPPYHRQAFADKK